MPTAPAKIDWQTQLAAKSGQFRIGGDLIINRLLWIWQVCASRKKESWGPAEGPE